MTYNIPYYFLRGWPNENATGWAQDGYIYHDKLRRMPPGLVSWAVTTGKKSLPLPRASDNPADGSMPESRVLKPSSGPSVNDHEWAGAYSRQECLGRHHAFDMACILPTCEEMEGACHSCFWTCPTEEQAWEQNPNMTSRHVNACPVDDGSKLWRLQP